PPRQPAAQRNPHRLTLEIFCMLLHLIGLLDRVLNSQVTGAKPLQVQTVRVSVLVPGRPSATGITRFIAG
ncbi:hypothetical protein, partial [Novosphingobium sp.]|uniref:hypothetical protein n=1 Tax=Novosphingobium sp. TaxID=1874826 RepID=UPI0025DFABCD